MVRSSLLSYNETKRLKLTGAMNMEGTIDLIVTFWEVFSDGKRVAAELNNHKEENENQSNHDIHLNAS